MTAVPCLTSFLRFPVSEEAVLRALMTLKNLTGLQANRVCVFVCGGGGGAVVHNCFRVGTFCGLWGIVHDMNEAPVLTPAGSTRGQLYRNERSAKLEGNAGQGAWVQLAQAHLTLGTYSSCTMCMRGRGVSFAWLLDCREIGNRASLLPPTALPIVQAALAVAVPDLTDVLTRYRGSLGIVERAMVCLQNIGTEAKDAVRDQRGQPYPHRTRIRTHAPKTSPPTISCLC
jgi:hypothetical protein